MAVIVHDTRDKASKHKNLDDYLVSHGHQVVRSKMYVGDITLLNDQSVCIDLKRNLAEVVVNVCQQHDRFVREIKRANEAGIKLIFLIEQGGSFKSLEDVMNWVNPRLKESPLAVSGERLYRIMYTMQREYGIEWHFCDRASTGAVVIKLLKIE